MTLVPLLLWLAVAMSACAWIAWRLYYFEPRPWRPLPAVERIHGRLGGWLYVLLVALFLRLLMDGAALVGMVRAAASIVATGEIQPARADVSVAEVTVRMVVMVADQLVRFGCSAVLLVLLLRRRRSFPWALCSVVALGIALDVFRLLPSSWIPRTLFPATPASIGQQLASAALWIAYLRLSDRAAATFVVPAPARPRWL